MKRRLFNLALAISALLSVALLTCWARSRTAQDVWTRRSIDSRGSMHVTTLYSGSGLFLVRHERESYPTEAMYAAMRKRAPLLGYWD